MSADERELNKASQSCDYFGELGLPPDTVYTGRVGGGRLALERHINQARAMSADERELN